MLANLARNYGTAADDVIAQANGDRSLLEPLSPALPDCGAEALYAIRHEMALTLEDVVFRRTGLGTLGAPGDDVIARVATLMQSALGWSEEDKARQIEAVNAHFRWGTA